MRPIPIILTFFLLLAGYSAKSQYYSFNKLVQAGDQSYERDQFLLAFDFYSQASEMKGKLQKQSLYRYADAAININNLDKAESLFMSYLENDRTDDGHEVLLKLIKIRQRQGRYEEAVLDCNIYMSEYEEIDPVLTHEVGLIKESCQWVLANNGKAIVDTVEHYPGVNSAYSEQAPFLYNDTLYFNAVKTEVFRDRQATYVSRLYKGDAATVLEIDGIGDEKFVSHPSFSIDSRFFLYSVGSRTDEGLQYDIYFSVVDQESKPGVPRKMLAPVNSDNYSSMHAVLVPLDTVMQLYYSSDKPGGTGGFDIYRAELSQDMIVRNEINLKSINTPGDEVSPFINFNTNDLYFSSDGHPGFGGLDIFRIDLESLDDGEVENVGDKVNSPLDDLFYSSSDNGSQIYFASNRSGSAFLDSRYESCCFDIYTAEVTECSINLLALIYDKASEQMLDNSSFAVIDPETLDTVYSHRSEENIHEVELECDKEYIIEVEREGYDLNQLTFKPLNFSYGQENEIMRKIYMNPSVYDLNLTVLSKDTKLPLDSLDVVIENLVTGAREVVTRHPSNKLQFKLEPGTDYRLDVSRRGYRDTTEIFNSGNTIPVIDKTVYLSEKEIIRQAKVSLAEAIPVALYFDHDAPGPGDSLHMSARNYTDSYDSYYAKRGRYIYNYVSKFRGSRQDNARREASQFFDNEVRGGFDKYDNFKTQLLLVLESGQKVNVYLRGYASPIALDEYNKALGRRRVDSVRQEFDDWNDGALLPYIESGQLLVTERSFGEETSPTDVSDDPRQPYQSIYSPSASRERRVEIDEINFNDEK